MWVSPGIQWEPRYIPRAGYFSRRQDLGFILCNSQPETVLGSSPLTSEEHSKITFLAQVLKVSGMELATSAKSSELQHSALQHLKPFVA